MGERTYKQLNWTSRIKLETMLKHGHSKKEIAEELGVHISTIYRELKRGTYTVVGKKRTKARLLVLSERVTRREIIIRIKDGRAETVVAALDRLERIYGAAFY